MDTDGSNPTNLTNNGLQNRSPSWSPDGSKIAFESRRNSNGGNIEIYVMDVDGSNQTIITNDCVPNDDGSFDCNPNDAGDNSAPSWGPIR